MRIVIIGAVSSTLTTLKQLIHHNMDVVGVLGYEPKSTQNVSGYSLLKPTAESNKIAYRSFVKINDLETIKQLEEWQPDIIFVVGLSQLVGNEILNLSPNGVVGFHPTPLPRGRGRAPLAWSVLKEKQVGANFFLIDNGVDSGPILAQELFEIDENDYAEDVEIKILEAIKLALDGLLPKLKQGILESKPQDASLATYYGRRAPNDGCIDWSKSAIKIHRLVRASSKPHPGAITVKEDFKVVVWKSRLEKDLKNTGVIGRILLTNNQKELLVQTGDGLLWITEYQVFDFDANLVDESLKVGQKLGYYSDIELYKIKAEINELKKRI